MHGSRWPICSAARRLLLDTILEHGFCLARPVILLHFLQAWLLELLLCLRPPGSHPAGDGGCVAALAGPPHRRIGSRCLALAFGKALFCHMTSQEPRPGEGPWIGHHWCRGAHHWQRGAGVRGLAALILLAWSAFGPPLATPSAGPSAGPAACGLPAHPGLRPVLLTRGRRASPALARRSELAYRPRPCACLFRRLSIRPRRPGAAMPGLAGSLSAGPGKPPKPAPQPLVHCDPFLLLSCGRLPPAHPSGSRRPPAIGRAPESRRGT